ncbi:eukaryotic translation initiation factor 5B-like [Papaver somniferum]|uniref:eukaryotic translation initiation factor 5B-like n=1 Tax=Papaver somniferum TaxID=3469 RepID=UPI000E70590C|nr:eukaryotic translation initiation factor 5B-like [Papaver somniferum]
MLMRKQEGKPITRKQKNEACRLELLRNQFLTQKSKSAPAKENGGASATNSADDLQLKEMNAAKNTNTREVDSILSNSIEEVEVKHENEGKSVEEEEIEDKEWHTKSWGDSDVQILVKSAFASEEVEPSVVKKEAKCATSPDSGTAVKPYTASGGGVPQYLECEDVKSDVAAKNRRKDAAAKREAQTMEVPPKRGEDKLRSPICCIMGHVDTGKTKLLDCIRGTNVQEGEAGGITQQIGATYFPAVNIRERTRELKADAKLRVPGLLVIDTPGHESFTNLRSRGSGLCDIAILVVDIMHGLERQTIESLNLLKMRNTEFIVALNKVDRLSGWKTCKNKPIFKAMKQQSKDVQMEFNWRLTQIITQLKEQGLNTELYYKNKEMGETYNIVPTSAISGEGIPDLLLLLVKWTEKTLVEKLMFTNEVQCTVLEVKAIEGQGTTIDVVLVNGVLHEGDQIVVCGTQVFSM